MLKISTMILDTIFKDNISSELRAIVEKVENKERISFDDGVLLFEKADLGLLGVLANYVRENLHGDKTYFNRNFHIEPTNICIYDCEFC